MSGSITMRALRTVARWRVVRWTARTVLAMVIVVVGFILVVNVYAIATGEMDAGALIRQGMTEQAARDSAEQVKRDSSEAAGLSVSDPFDDGHFEIRPDGMKCLFAYKGDPNPTCGTPAQWDAVMKQEIQQQQMQKYYKNHPGAVPQN